jgi:hypothetical protein
MFCSRLRSTSVIVLSGIVGLVAGCSDGEDNSRATAGSGGRSGTGGGSSATGATGGQASTGGEGGGSVATGGQPPSNDGAAGDGGSLAEQIAANCDSQCRFVTDACNLQGQYDECFSRCAGQRAVDAQLKGCEQEYAELQGCLAEISLDDIQCTETSVVPNPGVCKTEFEVYSQCG